MSNDDLLTSTEAGALLGRSGRTVVRMAVAGKLPYVRRLPGENGGYLFSRTTLKAWAKTNAVQVAS